MNIQNIHVKEHSLQHDVLGQFWNLFFSISQIVLMFECLDNAFALLFCLKCVLTSAASFFLTYTGKCFKGNLNKTTAHFKVKQIIWTLPSLHMGNAFSVKNSFVSLLHFFTNICH